MRGLMMHITNGDTVLYLFRKAGIIGTQFAWVDALYEGPVPADATLEELTRVRANYASARGYGIPIAIHRAFEKRDAALRKAGDADEIVLWFEHDLFDQLQVLQIVVALDDLHIDRSRVSIVQTDAYLGVMTAPELGALFPKRRSVSASAFRHAREAWDAFTAPTPAGWPVIAAHDTLALPHLRPAFRRLTEELPAVRDGLSRSQRQALDAVVSGPAVAGELFRRAQSHEEAAFLGDAQFAAVLRDLASEPAPLVTLDADRYDATPLGRRVLSGDVDWLDEAPIDRWVGGTHLTAQSCWRYDDARGAIVAPVAALP